MPPATKSVPRKAAPRTRAQAAVVAPARSHRHSDVTGVVMIALGIVLLIALSVGRGGMIGNALGSFFSQLFGRGAWIAPVTFVLVGIASLAGRKQFEVGRFSWGIGLLFAFAVGLLARARGGDYFDPEAAAASGGYLGAVVGWMFEALLGQAKYVGIGALGMVGLILCIDTPIRHLIAGLPKPNAIPKRAVVTVPERGSSERENRSRALRETLAQLSEDEEKPGKSEKTISPKTRPLVKHTEAAPSMVTLDPIPKEGYVLPPVTVLREAQSRHRRTPEEMQRNIEILEGTLEEFGIEANVVEIATGPTITRYEVQLGPGVRVSRISQLGDNIAMSLAARDVRVEAPIPGKNAIGVEVPNEKSSVVTLRELCETKEYQDHPSRLLVGLGQDVSGHNRYADLTKMPHLLIGGATNSGKSIGLATIITSLLMRNTPKECRLVMIDPKRVELSLFDGVPHLLCPVVKDVKDAPGVLRAVWREMDMRYDLLSEKGVRNIDGWNAKASFQDQLPYIVVIIDELADLMIQAKAEVETSIVRLAQLSRAVGIHLVIATQRPSVDVITGLIKANIPSRIAFAVSSHIDSRTILDGAGAERLVGRGDMLYLPIDANKPVRIQGCYVSEQEIEEICRHWKEQERPQYTLKPVAAPGEERVGREDGDEEADELWEDAVRWVVERGQASTSMMQRKFSIGFQRASRLLDMMEERGIIGPKQGAKPREVLVDPMDVETLFGGLGAPLPEMDPLD